MNYINLFNVNKYVVDTNEFDNLTHDDILDEFCHNFCSFVAAEHGCLVQSATAALILCLWNKPKTKVCIPSMIPNVVVNAITLSGHDYCFVDNTEWVGHSYIFHEFDDYKVIDSAQELRKNQFKEEANPQDLMIFSFYQTKPVGSIDGGIIVSNDKQKIDYLRTLSFNGMTQEKNSWERKIVSVGWKMYMNSVQAYIAQKNLERFPEKNERLTYVRDYYNKEFKLDNTSNYLYRVPVNSNKDQLERMNSFGIQCGIHYKGLHRHKVYKNSDTSLPNTEYHEKTQLSIPFHENITNSGLSYIVNKLKPYVLN